MFAVVGGSPADCVVAGMTFVCKDLKPDLVLSGVNNGQNLGDILNCSGTVAGAREGALHGALGIGISQGVNYERGTDIDWTNSRTYSVRVIKSLIDNVKSRGDAYFNVNLPFCAPEDVSGVRVVPFQRFSRSPMALLPQRQCRKILHRHSRDAQAARPPARFRAADAWQCHHRDAAAAAAHAP